MTTHMEVRCDEDGLELRVPDAAVRRRLDTLLRRDLGFGRGLIRRIRVSGRFEMNGSPAFLWQTVEPGDTVSVVWPQALATGTEADAPDLTASAHPEPIPLDVIYEDPHLLAVNKPAGMLVHPVRQHRSGTVANAVSYHLVALGRPPKVRPLHRLDRGTSGLVLFAKHPYSLLRLTSALKEGHIHREYVGVVTGVPEQSEGWIDLPIRRAEESIIRREIAPPGEGRTARTHFHLEASSSTHALVRLQLQTGRTHQIRVHMAAIHHPLVGDGLYGPEGDGDRPALHAVRLELPHPMTGERLELVAPLPSDLRALCGRLNLPV